MTKVLVTGATGNVGSQVVRELQERGASVRAFVRDTGKAAGMFGDGVELASGNFSDAASVRRALEGVEGVFIACANDPRQVEYETGVIDAAAATGVRRIVKLSAHQGGGRLARRIGTGTAASRSTCGRRGSRPSCSGPPST